jgi:nifR3 family TIM-barrel protein
VTAVLDARPAGAPAPLRLGALTVDPAVVLAPMAGITGPAFRTLCREFGAGLYVCEMITTRALVERNEKTLRMVRATTEEHDAFSVQLYGVDPATVGRAVELLVDECVAGTRPAHIDLNFGCPVPKVTRKGGGAALPWRRRLFGDVVSAAVRAAGDVPVTVKTRVGIDPQHHTYLEAGAIAQGAGAAAITLHGRTADWTHIARLVEAVDIPVLGNGDVWEADDALRMVAETGCAGVVVGRGCLGRPWLFGDLAAAFAGSTQRALPTFREVAAVMHRHATLLAAEHGETHGCSDFRKHVAWYTKGFSVGSDTRRALAMVSSLDELAELLAGVEDQPYPVAVLGAPRGRTTPPRPVALPAGWLDDRDDPRPPVGAELLVGGG